jgi:spore coat polysaccharide biosynthesis protein SpsF
MSRKLVAALACRSGGTRLYGKPLQNISMDEKLTILDYMIDGMKACGAIDEIVLGIAEGNENLVYQEIAKRHGVSFIVGSEKDVLYRLVQCGLAGRATDVFRVTSECPFVAWEYVSAAWDSHVTQSNDVTVTDYMAEGLNFEIYSMASLIESHEKGSSGERSEFCSLYVRNNMEQFQVEIIKPEEQDCRIDQRLTVDYPEDLILCRFVYEQLKKYAPHIPVSAIVKLLDDHPEVAAIVKPFIDTNPVWASRI